FLIDYFERSQAAGHGEIVPAESSRVNYATVHPAEGFLVNVAPGYDRAARHVTTTQGLGQGNDVRFEVPMLKPKHLAGSSETALDLVGNEKCAVVAAEMLRGRGNTCVRGFASFA